MRKNCSRDREKLLKFEAEGREFEFFLRSLEQFIQTVKSQSIIFKLEKNIGIEKHAEMVFCYQSCSDLM